MQDQLFPTYERNSHQPAPRRRRRLCECGTCALCEQREYQRQWRERNPDYFRNYYDARDPERIKRRQQYGRQQHDYTPEQDALLGTKVDVEVAALLGKSWASVRKRRTKLGIPPFRTFKRTTNERGYIIVRLQPDDPLVAMARRGRQIPEHRLVMARHLGRELADDEFVHHRNGVRDDNRIENLELWSRSHPDGQRVEDILDWAISVVERYGEEFSRNGRASF